MQQDASSQYPEEYELKPTNAPGSLRDQALDDEPHIYGSGDQSRLQRFNASNSDPTTSSSSPVDALEARSTSEPRANQVLVRKHVPLVVLPQFHEKPTTATRLSHGWCGFRYRKDGIPDREGEVQERSGVNGDAEEPKRGIEADLQGERSHRSSNPWMATFFDLIFVAILSTFSVNHGIINASSLLNFFAFFVLLWWSWLAQVTYDVRFETDDLLHRFFKLLQLCGLAYLGAATGAWDVTHFAIPSDIFAENAGDNYLAHGSLVTVMSAYVGLRFILAFQYAVLLFISRQVRRYRRDLLLPLVSNLISCGLILAGVLVTGSSEGLVALKLSLLYVGLLAEVVGGLVTFLAGSFLRLDDKKTTERIGNLTLIIIGEGFNGILAKFNLTIESFSSDNVGTYVNAGCAIVILFFLFEFTFTGFDHHLRKGRRRTTLWILLQFPTHFCLLMYFAAIGNVNVASSFISGVSYAQDAFLIPAYGLGSADNNTTQIREYFLTNRKLAAQLLSLNLFPPWRDEVWQLVNASSYGIDVETESYKYSGQIIVASAIQQYEFDIDEDAYLASIELAAVNSTVTPGSRANSDRALTLLLQILGDLTTDVFAGTFWLFPTAGGSLILLALADMIRYRESNRTLRILAVVPVLFGIALGLLGLLNVGEHRITLTASNVSDSSSPLYQVLVKNWTLPICTLSYAAVWLLTKGVIFFVYRRLLRQQRGWKDGKPAL